MTKVLLLSVGLGAAVVAVVIAGVVVARHQVDRRATPAASVPVGTGGAATWEPVLNADYLTRYARRKFGPLLAQLDTSLPAGHVERMAGILAEREIALADAREKARGAGLAPDVYVATQSARIRERLAAEFGESVAVKVESFIRTLPQRLIVGGLNETLLYRGAGLSVAQIDRLCLLLNAAEGGAPVRFPGAAEMERYIADKERAYREVSATAAQELSPVQAEGLREELDYQIALLRMQQRGQRQAHRPGSDDSRASSPAL